MHRRVFWFSSLPTLVVALLPSLAGAQESTAEVEYLDRTKNNARTVRKGSIVDENPAKVIVSSGLTTKTRTEIPTADIVDVKYEGEPPEMLQARSAERAKDNAKALDLYQEALKKVPSGNRFLKAHVQFKVARLMALQAEGGVGANRPTAIQKLQEFKKDHPYGRQIVEALNLLSRLLLMDGKPTNEVVDAFKALKLKFSENKEIAARCDLFESQVLLQEAEALMVGKPDDAKKKFAEAQTKLESMLKTADRAGAMEMKIGLAQCKAALGNQADALKSLDQLLKEATDDSARAAVYLGRGDCYFFNNQHHEAKWEYLWVDVIYNQDREQVAKALYYLSQIFEKIDPPKAKEAKDRLNRDFKDTRYQKKVIG